ncbi:MAG: hypothetical protein EOP38_19320 [Rubrivivax sp.]|nr:MAG: hypothetical protein EOP38_19320 [Rubrivivax sp.]
MVYLQITLNVSDLDRPAAAGVYQQYKTAFLKEVPGALSKDLLIRPEDVQVVHGFDSKDHALGYLESSLFTQDVVKALSPLLKSAPEVRVYDAA